MRSAYACPAGCRHGERLLPSRSYEARVGARHPQDEIVPDGEDCVEDTDLRQSCNGHTCEIIGARHVLETLGCEVRKVRQVHG